MSTDKSNIAQRILQDLRRERGVIKSDLLATLEKRLGSIGVFRAPTNATTN